MKNQDEDDNDKLIELRNSTQFYTRINILEEAVMYPTVHYMKEQYEENPSYMNKYLWWQVVYSPTTMGNVN